MGDGIWMLVAYGIDVIELQFKELLNTEHDILPNT